MTRLIKFTSYLFCMALLLSCSEDYECLHCKEGFFEDDVLSSSSNAISSSSDAYCTEPEYGSTMVGSTMWMTENLKSGGCCELSKQEDWHCHEFGRLYGWQEARNACPQGWRLPTYDEFQAYLQSETIELPSGYWDATAAGIIGTGSYEIWFVIKESNTNIIYLNGSQIEEFPNNSSNNLYSIRCVGDI